MARSELGRRPLRDTASRSGWPSQTTTRSSRSSSSLRRPDGVISTRSASSRSDRLPSPAEISPRAPRRRPASIRASAAPFRSTAPSYVAGAIARLVPSVHDPEPPPEPSSRYRRRVRRHRAPLGASFRRPGDPIVDWIRCQVGPNAAGLARQLVGIAGLDHRRFGAPWTIEGDHRCSAPFARLAGFVGSEPSGCPVTASVSTAAIEFDGITKTYGRTTALDRPEPARGSRRARRPARPQWRRQDHGDQARARAGAPDRRHRARARGAARRPAGSRPDRLPARAVPLPALAARPRGPGPPRRARRRGSRDGARRPPTRRSTGSS